MIFLKDFDITPDSPLPGGPSPGGSPQPGPPRPKPKPQAPRARKCPACNGAGVMHPRRFGVPCHVCDGKGTLSKSFCYGLPHNTAWTFLKEADLTPAQWKPDIQQNGAQPQQSAEGGTIGDTPKKTPEEEMREKESDHNMTVNNPATQEWFTGLLPDAVDFRQKLLSTVQAPGTALHDPNYKTNVKPMEKTGNELDKLIAHMRSMHSDTPGPGRGTMGNGASKPKNSAAAEFQRQFMDQGGD